MLFQLISYQLVKTTGGYNVVYMLDVGFSSFTSSSWFLSGNRNIIEYSEERLLQYHRGNTTHNVIYLISNDTSIWGIWVYMRWYIQSCWLHVLLRDTNGYVKQT